MKVFTTRKTWDPFIILKARDMIKLVSRGFPYEQVCLIFFKYQRILKYCSMSQDA